MRKMLPEPADGLRAFHVGPDLFREYAEWRPTVGRIIARDYNPEHRHYGLLVFYLNKDETDPP